jgi:hypothetical protein
LLVIALGGIGSEIGRRAFGFGMRVLATDPKVIEKPLFVEELHRPDDFHSLLPRADVVASAVPLTPLSRGMIGEKEFGMMKRGTILINVSRGRVVDTEALAVRRYRPLPRPASGPEAAAEYRKAAAGREALVPEAYRRLKVGKFHIPADAVAWNEQRPTVLRAVVDSLGDLPPRPSPSRARIISRELRPG